MNKEIQSIIILSEGGNLIFSDLKNESELDYFTGFLSAFISFIETTLNQEVISISLECDEIVLLKDKIILCAICPKMTNRWQVKKKLQEILDVLKSTEIFNQLTSGRIFNDQVLLDSISSKYVSCREY